MGCSGFGQSRDLPFKKSTLLFAQGHKQSAVLCGQLRQAALLGFQQGGDDPMAQGSSGVGQLHGLAAAGARPLFQPDKAFFDKARDGKIDGLLGVHPQSADVVLGQVGVGLPQGVQHPQGGIRQAAGHGVVVILFVQALAVLVHGQILRFDLGVHSVPPFKNPKLDLNSRNSINPKLDFVKEKM